MHSRKKTAQNSALVSRQTSPLTTFVVEYQLSMIAIGAVSTFISRKLIESDLDILGIPSIVNAFSFGVTTCALIIAVSHQINNMANSTKLNIQAQESLPASTDSRELANTNPRSQPSIQRKPISIPLIAKARRGFGKKHAEAHAWPSLSELKNWISFSKLKETWLSRQTKSKQDSNEAVLTSAITDLDLLEDQTSEKSQPKRKKHNPKKLAKPHYSKNEEKQTNVTISSPPSLSTTNIYSCLDAPTHAQSQLPLSIASSSHSTTNQPLVLGEMATPLTTQPTSNALLSNEANVIDAPCVNHLSTASNQPLENSEELKNQLALMRTQVALLSEQLLESKSEKIQQSEQLKEVSRLFQLIAPESKTENSSTGTLNLNQMKQIVEQLHKIQITMSHIKETSTNPNSYIQGAYTQRSHLAELCKNLLVLLDEANPTYSIVTTLRPG